MVEFKDLLGKTLIKIDIDYNNDKITFYCNNETVYQLFHQHDCCESVTIDDIVGDLEDLLENPITLAEEVSNYEPTSEEDIKRTEEINRWGSCTWTFYKLATVKGYVDIKWFGESNGYYSESVDFKQL
jgi:Golgi nucleoside diphosphatase